AAARRQPRDRRCEPTALVFHRRPDPAADRAPALRRRPLRLRGAPVTTDWVGRLPPAATANAPPAITGRNTLTIELTLSAEARHDRSGLSARHEDTGLHVSLHANRPPRHELDAHEGLPHLPRHLRARSI